MLQGKKTRRMVAATLLTILLTDTFAPAVSYALTSGPTQPEATSFEPVDTTDMVNLQTGDLTYNIPLLEVPGPEGGYPLSLSYHAGIQTNEDASWVGLGWTLNPGAISRSVNGLPDDWDRLQGNTHTYWEGGVSSNYSVGLTVGVANTPVSVSFGLSESYDTYKGFSVGYSASVGPLSLTWQPYSKATLSLSYQSQLSPDIPYTQTGSTSVGLSISTNFSSVNVGINGGLGVMGEKISGSLSSDGKSTSGVSGGGAPFFMHSSTASKVQTSTWGLNNFNINLGLVDLRLSYSQERYWTNEITTTYCNGSLYDYNNYGTSIVYDNYSLLDDPSMYNIEQYPDPTVMQGGALPDFDDYSVMAQGLGGSIRPYLYQGQLMGQEQLNASGQVQNQYYTNEDPGIATGFRFVDDFSNAFVQQPYAPYSAAQMTTNLASDLTTPPFATSALFGSTSASGGYANGPQTNNYGATYPAGAIGNFNQVALAGSRHVDVGVKTNPSNIYSNNPGNTPVNRYVEGMISGFAITNESGVTYNYGLPAYSYNEENYQEKIKTPQNESVYFNRSTKANPYAYTWYLTTITGSDYVDRNNNQIADEGDWGYWVNFEYGKWSNEYAWRNPSQGLARDEDQQFQDVSMGYREVYYLNAIRTRSYIALFEKDVRNDAKGASPQIFCKNGGSQNQDYTYPQGVYDENSSQSLQLSHIYVLNIADANTVPVNAGSVPSLTPPGRTYISCLAYNPCPDCELGDNVLESRDVDAVGRAYLESKSIRVIDFTYDYSLCPNTTNSYNTLNTVTPGPLTGKLTLKALTMRGKGGASSLPSMQFSYELPPDMAKSATGTVSPTSFVTSTTVFQVGDMLQSNGTYYGQVTNFDGASTYTLANSSLPAGSSGVSLTLTTTKNPPYYMDAYDMWGLYKGDYNETAITADENLGRYTSAASAPGTDAWSLHAITTQLGDNIELNYQPDSYHTVVMDNTYSLTMQNVSVVSGTGGATNGTISFTLANLGSSTNPGATIGIGTIFPQVTLLLDATSVQGNYIKVPTPITTLTITGIATGGANGTVYTGTLGAPITYSTFDGQIWTGNLWVDQTNTDYYGGGMRVGSIVIKHTFDNSVSTISYNYNNPVTGYSSGETSYLPVTLDAYDATAVNTIPAGRSYLTTGVFQNWYQRVLYKNVNTLYPIVRELPSPGVMYQYVTETDQYSNPDEPSARNVMGSMQYQFEVFNSNMVGREVVDPNNPIVGTYTSSLVETERNWVLRKFTTCIGNVKSITQYDALGNILKQTTNHYLHDGLESLDFHDFLTQYNALLQPYNYQGLIEERYSEIKDVQGLDPSAQLSGEETETNEIYGNMVTMLAREDYPCIQTSQTVTDYATGVTTSTSNLAFDFYSGSPLQTLATDAYGNNFMTTVIPAYQLTTGATSNPANQSVYPALGLKINADANKNMLVQPGETYIYKVDANKNPLELVSADVTTYSNGFSAMDVDGSLHVQNGTADAGGPTGNVWRSQSAFSWQPTAHTSDGLTLPANFVDYNWGTGATQDSRWVNTSTVTLYDTYSKSLEAQDVNKNYSATHMSYGENKVILTGSPANYYEMAYSGAEDAAITQPSTSFIQASAGTVATGTGVAHTGAQSLLLNGGSTTGFLYSVPVVASGTGGVIAGRSYTAAAWVKPVSGTASNVSLYYSVGGTTLGQSVSSASSTKAAGGWILITLTINGSSLTAGSTLKVWCENDHATAAAYVDDMRFQPINSSTTAYVYDPFSGELTYTLDNSNLYTRYQYDGGGRLIDVYKEKLNSPQFSNQEFKSNQYQYNYGAKKFGNDPINETLAKNNCPLNGTTPSSVPVVIPGSTYTSFVSPGDADAIAAVYAQDYANTHGTCVCYPKFTFASQFTNGMGSITLSGNNVATFSLSFTYPTGATYVDLGTISPACALPATNMSVPYAAGNGATYTVTIYSTGDVQVGQSGGTATTNSVIINSAYGLTTPLGYNNYAQTQSFTEQCPAGEGGPTISYTIPAYTIWADNTQDANAMATSELQSQGQAAANAQNRCIVESTCPFTLASGLMGNGAPSFVDAGGVVTFSFGFTQPSANWTGGVVGTVSGACVPSSPVTIATTNKSTGANFQITISTTGVVTATQEGPPAGNASTNISLGGSYTQ